MSKETIIESILFIIGIILIQITGVWYYYLYTHEVTFGSAEFALANQYFYILVPAVIFALGVVFVGWKVRLKWIRVGKPRLVNAVFAFTAILSCIMVLTIWIGLPFDATYSWGTNAILFSKAFVAILPAILCIITIITLLIATSGNFWLMTFKCIVVVGITALVYYAIVPMIMQYL